MRFQVGGFGGGTGRGSLFSPLKKFIALEAPSICGKHVFQSTPSSGPPVTPAGEEATVPTPCMDPRGPYSTPPAPWKGDISVTSPACQWETE
jgi:hypothetical protein